MIDALLLLLRLQSGLSGAWKNVPRNAKMHSSNALVALVQWLTADWLMTSTKKAEDQHQDGHKQQQQQQASTGWTAWKVSDTLTLCQSWLAWHQHHRNWQPADCIMTSLGRVAVDDGLVRLPPPVAEDYQMYSCDR